MNLNIFNHFPQLKLSDEILLRELKHTDANSLKNILSDPKVAPFIPNDVIPQSITQALVEINFLRSLFKNKKSVYWGINHADHGLIGTVGYENWQMYHNRLEVAFELHPKFWQRGIMSMCLKAIIDYAFEEMQVNRIEAYTLTTNEASHKTLLKVGFKEEGRLKKYRKFNGEFVDVIIFGLVNENTE